MKDRNLPRLYWLLAIVMLLSACGSGGHTASVSSLPPSIRYPQTSAFVVGASIEVLRPVISGNVTGGFTASPPLPPGLSIDPSFGNIFGTPTAPVPATVYTVDATSPEGRVTTTVSLTVLDVIPRISYSPNSYDLVQNAAIAGSIAPNLRGGVVVTWSIDRALPAGLIFDTSNGQISGTPTVASPSTAYRVSASNSGGTASTTLTISVQASMGTVHALLRAAGVPVCDSDCASGAVAGRSSTSARGVTAVLDGNRLTLLDNASGTRRWRIEVPAAIRWWQVARDDSYLVVATGTSLGVWSPTGALLFVKEADYGDALAFAAPGELRIGAGPAGAQVIETISVPAGDSCVSVPHHGAFRAWSEDGERFAASSGDNVWIYSRDAVHLEFAPRIPQFDH